VDFLRQAGRRTRSAAAVAPRVGLYGIFGAGNTGNDGSLGAMVAYLRAEHPNVILDCLCPGPEEVTARYGIPATRWHSYHLSDQRASGMGLALKSTGLALKCTALGVDAFRTASWVRHHDAVVVPGMGVLEAIVPLRPWQTPYRMFLLCASGRLFGTKVALVSVGTNVIRQRFTRRLFTAAARLAHYRSFRDTMSKDAMLRMGLDTSDDPVYPDVAFSLQPPRDEQGTAGAVGIGVMAYVGGNEDRREATDLYASYVDKMKRFVRWLVDNGHPVRLFTGDTPDERVVEEILADVRACRPELGPSWVIAEPVPSLDDLMREMTLVDTVVATRFHNVVCALKLAKPTLSIGYAAKHDVLMADMGLSRFCQSIKSLDVSQLIEQFTELESQSAQLRLMIRERNAAKARLVERQFAELSAVLFPEEGAARTADEHKPAWTGGR
jgi:polysaccharide pyruvyl transferase WcaK-like protein